MDLNNALLKSWFTARRLAKQVCVAALVTAVAIPLTASRAPSLLERIQSSGELVVISRNGPTTYYEGQSGYTGFEYTLASAFARHLGVALRIEEMEDLGAIIDAVGHKGHFAAAGLTVTERRKHKVQFGTPYLEVTQDLIYHPDTPRPASVEDIIGKRIVVIGNSAHAERLRELQREYPDLAWEERHDVEMLDLMEMVHNQKIDFAVVDSNAFDLNTSLYPKAKLAFSISDQQPLAWAFALSDDTSLVDAANAFLTEFKTSGALVDLKERVYGHLGEMTYSDALVFTKRLNTRLPKWKSLLQGAAEENALQWELLAAMSYQESHWNPRAKSPTGVRGFMMLTQSTAKEMKVKNRLNAEQSIEGGARYFRKLLDRLPENITGLDRLWLAMAAYNVGYGHVEDVRIITQQHGGNPNKWADVKEYLPLLSKRQYYKHTKHGYARGQEAVDYVQNIRNYYTVLAWNEVEQERLTQLAMTEPKAETSDFNSLISQLVANDSFAGASM